MPFSFSIDPGRRLAFACGEGDFDLEEAMGAPLELFAQPEFEPEFGVVVDVSAIQFTPTARDVIAIARNLVRFRALFEHRVGLVVNGGGMLRAAEISAAIAGASGFPMQVFSDAEKAEAWVDEGRDETRP